MIHEFNEEAHTVRENDSSQLGGLRWSRSLRRAIPKTTLAGRRLSWMETVLRVYLPLAMVRPVGPGDGGRRF